MENRRKIIVAGAGAAGLTAAIFAARQGAEVTILEAMERPAKKLLLTGNGRCNITNLDEHLPEAYYGSGREIAAALTKSFGAREMCDFLEELGLLTQEKNGYVYPYTGQSSSVLEVLLAEVRRLKIKLKLSEKIVRITENPAAHTSDKAVSANSENISLQRDTTDSLQLKKKNHGLLQNKHNAAMDAAFYAWTVETATWQYHADAVIITCGSKCVPSTGSDGSGYDLAKALGHTIVPVAPALTSVTCQYENLQALAGVRCRAKVSLYKCINSRQTTSAASHNENNANSVKAVTKRLGAKDEKVSLTAGNEIQLLASETGELQWTKYGVSGIVVFQLSRFVSNHRSKEPLYFSIDLLPDFEEEQIKGLLRNRAEQIRNEKAATLLSGFLNDRMIPVILKEADHYLAERSAAKGASASAARISAKNEAKSSTRHVVQNACQQKKLRSLTKYTCAELEPEQLDALVHVMKHLELPINGTKSFDTCQVCSGGIDCRELNPDTLESKLHPGLYFAGEIVDVDGPCGGYNLQWAWSSAYAAGYAAATPDR